MFCFTQNRLMEARRVEKSELGFLLVILCLGSGLSGLILQKTYRAFLFLTQDPPEADLYSEDRADLYLSSSEDGVGYCLFDWIFNFPPIQGACIVLLVYFAIFSLSLSLICLGMLYILDSLRIIHVQMFSAVPLPLKSLKVCLGFGLMALVGLSATTSSSSSSSYTDSIDGRSSV